MISLIEIHKTCNSLQKKWVPKINQHLSLRLGLSLSLGNASKDFNVNDNSSTIELSILMKKFLKDEIERCNCAQKIEAALDCIDNCLGSSTSEENIDDENSDVNNNIDEETEVEILNNEPLDKVTDALGEYIPKFANGSFAGEIKIYRKKVYDTALRLKIDWEKLFLIVLFHECAHAFHHCGLDTDKNMWSDFLKSSTNLRESLAQYYTEDFCNSQDEPSFIYAFEELLKIQPKAYSLHRKIWPSSTFKFEHIRVTFIHSRINNFKTTFQFNSELGKYSKSLK